MTPMVLYLTTAMLYLTGISTTTLPDTSQPNASNSCCQGPAGLHGIPGPAGNNGFPGRDGERGMVGAKGNKGEVGVGQSGPSGPQGPRGVNGESGQMGLLGLPGKVGPQGLKGIAGEDGQVGHKGSKGRGTKGQKGESGGTRRSAFTAIKTSSQKGNSGDVLTFDVMETNIGNRYNEDSDIFTCQIPGVYWFTFTMCKSSAIHHPYVDLVKNRRKIVRTRLYDNEDSHSTLDQASNGAVLQLVAGDQVWLQFGSSGQNVYSDSDSYTTFSGFLLYDD